jgi:hypothetical protein
LILGKSRRLHPRNGILISAAPAASGAPAASSLHFYCPPRLAGIR